MIYGSGNEMLAAHFKDMAYSPRKRIVSAIRLETGIAALYFFTESTNGKNAGIAEQFETKGVVSVVHGPEGHSPIQVLDEEEAKALSRAFSNYEWSYRRYKGALSLGLYDQTTSLLQEMADAAAHLAEDFNVIASFSRKPCVRGIQDFTQ